jgi:hypothetical protein
MRERRRLKRIVKRIPVRFQAESLRGEGHIKNLTQEGIFVRSDVLPEAGESISVRFDAPQGRKIEIEGVVRWTTAQFPDRDVRTGFGVRLHRVDEEYLRFFESILLN